MNLKTSITCILVCLTFLVQAQGLLWEISGKGLEKSSYLYGTMHVQEKEAFIMTDVLYEKLESVEAFASEVIIKEEDEEKFTDIFSLPEGKKLKNVLSKSNLKTFQKVFKERTGFDIEMFAGMSPVGLMFIEIELNSVKDYPLTVDDYLERISENQGKEILAVEALEDQLSLLSLITDEMAVEYFNDIEAGDVYAEQMNEFYLKQDVEKLAELFYQDPRYKNMMDAFITKRNYTMTASIEKLIANKSTFVAVGSGHLGGKEGIISLLKKDGYTVVPLSGEFVGYRSDLSEKQEDWKVFSPKDMPFSFALPTEEMKTESQEMETEKGMVKMHMFGYEPTEEDSPVKIYMTIFTTTINGENSETITKEELKAFFDESQTGMEARYGKEMDIAKDINIQGYPGRDYQTSFMGGMAQVYMRTLLVKDGFIIMQIFETSAAETKRQKYFDSLKIK